MTAIEPRALREFTTLAVGGTPEHLFVAETRDELIDTLREIWSTDDSWLVVGGGSNLLISDDDVPSNVVLLRTSGIERLADPADGIARVRVAAGHVWDDFVTYTVEQGLAGVEALSGIPGTVGAAPVQNVGAYGQEVVQTLVSVELIDVETHDVVEVPASELGLGSRTSVLKSHYGEDPVRDAVILSVTFDLRIVGDEAITLDGSQVRTALGLEEGSTISLRDVRERILTIRGSKGMVLDADDADTTSAGSFFTNPILPEAFVRTLPAGCPRWPIITEADNDVVIELDAYEGEVPPLVNAPAFTKVSAAWLIEHSGLAKGFKLPGSRASLSTKHTLALTNRGGASAEEVAALARFVRSRVQAEYGVLLTPEPVFVGVEL